MTTRLDSFDIPRFIRRDREAPSRRIARQLAEQRIVVVDNFVGHRHQEALRRVAQRRWAQDEFRAARIGAGSGTQLQTEIRSDRVCWLDEDSMTAAESRYLHRLESLRLAINRELYLGLFDWEGHLAVYPEGAFYRRHLDRFQHDGRRTVSTVLYLNDHWRRGDGGELRAWSGAESDSAFVDIEPLSGRLVIFLSGEVYHGVQPSSFERISVTGWFRTRSDKLN